MSDRPTAEPRTDVPARARTDDVPATTAPAATRAAATAGPPLVPIARVGTGRRVGLGLIALCCMLIGAWSAIVAFAGPSFGYALDNAPAWSWSGHRLLLHLIPGVVAVAAGVVIAVVAGAWRRTGGLAGTGSLTIAGVFLAACGAWLVLGQDVWSVLRGPFSAYYQSPNQWIHFTRVVGIQLGPGLVLAMMGALSVGLAMLGPERRIHTSDTQSTDLVGTPSARDRTGAAVR